MIQRNLHRRAFLSRLGGFSLLTITGLGVFGCRHRIENSDSGSSSTGTTDNSAMDDSVYEIRMIGSGGVFVFEPDRLIIHQGDVVRFVVESSGHTATAYHPDIRSLSPLRIPETAEPWDSGLLSSSGQVYEHKFVTKGVHNYYCLPHEGVGMVGIIVVDELGEGPGLAEPQDVIPQAARTKLSELISWAKSQI